MPRNRIYTTEDVMKKILLRKFDVATMRIKMKTFKSSSTLRNIQRCLKETKTKLIIRYAVVCRALGIPSMDSIALVIS